MQNIDDIKIVSIDTDRPPIVRKEAYIDLFFKLSEKAPLDWCDDFNALGRQIDPGVKIDKNVGLCVDAWVKDMGQIAPHLEKIKLKILECNEQYIEKARQKQLALLAANTSQVGTNSEQFKLNEIIADLKF
jgi:hypothetical protein